MAVIAARLLIGAVMILESTSATAEINLSRFEASWTQVLKDYQSESGLFNYKKLKGDLDLGQAPVFDNLVSQVQTVSEEHFMKLSANAQKAFLINAYNILTVKLVADNYPVKSIKKIGGFFTKPWKINFFKMLSGKIKNLDSIEHDWLRPKFRDFRVHAAVNCASISCPSLRHEAYSEAKLNEQLDEQMRLWVNDPHRNELDPVSSSIAVSKIFDWYKEDFDKWGGGVLTVINKYKNQPFSQTQMSQLKIKFLEYNWDLNELK